MSSLEIGKDAGVNSEVNFYKLLGVEPTESQQGIRQAYIRAKENFRNTSYSQVAGEGEARRYRQLIEVAFNTLSDDKNKKIYNQRMNIMVGSDLSAKTPFVPQYKPLTKKIIDAKVLSQYKQVLDDPDLTSGEKIKKIRLLAGLTPTDVWKSTKISQEYLGYFEANQFEKLPALVYSKGLLRAYCEYLCIPSQDRFVAAYIEEINHYRETSEQI